MNTENRALAAGLADSIRQYRCILDLLQTMDREIHIASHVQLQKMTQKLSELQNQARELDSPLQLRLFGEGEPDDEDLGSLLTERQEVIREILVLNAAVRKQAQGAQSLLAHELGALRQGHTALSGYKSQQDKGGRIVNSAT